MKLLLDTPALIWFGENSPALSRPAKDALEDRDNELVCSVASVWEMAIKASLGKLKLGLRLDTSYRRRLEEWGFAILPVEYAHASLVLGLPWPHRDPFDRLLVAQAMVEGLTLVSHDQRLDAYPIKRLW
jgi:PIN domain nuclease of toxin-antitoxin system